MNEEIITLHKAPIARIAHSYIVFTRKKIIKYYILDYQGVGFRHKPNGQQCKSTKLLRNNCVS